MEKQVFEFLNRHYRPEAKILLALSGGADSMALFHALIAYKQKFNYFEFSIVHVNHGWRKESEGEAIYLEKMAEDYGIIFHFKKIDPKQLTGNLEETCRIARLAIYKDLCDKFFYRAVLLGHHADDQAETVLKRIFEGGDLPFLHGLKEITHIYGVELWRPLLPLTKKEILNWLHQKKIHFFFDITNSDETYLRARFRQSLMPGLEASFGKNIRQRLNVIGKEASDLKDYLDAKIAPLLSKVERGPHGLFLDISDHIMNYDYEIKYLIKRFCMPMDVCLAKSQIEDMCAHIKNNAANKKFTKNNFIIHIDRKKIFLSFPQKRLPEEKLTLIPGEHHWGGWRILIKEVKEPSPETLKSGWRAVWKGECSIDLPYIEGDFYQLGHASPNKTFPGTNHISKWWTEAKVPAFLREHIPVIWQNDKIIHEFLTGKQVIKGADCRKKIRVNLQKAYDS